MWGQLPDQRLSFLIPLRTGIPIIAMGYHLDDAVMFDNSDEHFGANFRGVSNDRSFA
jgi:hypothetical protein